VRERMKIQVRKQFDQEQPVIDVLRQVHGIMADPSSPHKDSRPCSPEQDAAFQQLFRMVPLYSSEERRWRAATVDTVAQVQPGAKRRLRALRSPKPEPTPHMTVTRRTGPTLPVVSGHRTVIADNQCLWCAVHHIAGETLKTPFSRKRHERSWHYGKSPHSKSWRCPDAACAQTIVHSGHWENHRNHYHVRPVSESL
jgi:hypothetical protein